MNRHELLTRLQGFEWNDFECKRASRAVPEDAWKTVSAFSNTAGGYLVFGVVDHNGQLEICGVDEPDKIQNDFLGALRGGQKFNRQIDVKEYRYEIEGKHVFAFHIPEAGRFEKPVYLKGDPRQSYRRRGAGDEQCHGNELERYLRDAAMERFDREPLPHIPVAKCFDPASVNWYQSRFAQRHPEHAVNDDMQAFLLHWNFIVEQNDVLVPTRAGILLFGHERFVRQILPRPVLDYQRIDMPFENWSFEQRWDDRYVFEENLIQTWRGLVSRYMRIAEHPFALDPATLRRNDDPPDYVAFREAAINLLVHQDYGDHGRKASIRLFTDQTIFWNPGDALANEAELLDSTEKDVRNPGIVSAFRRIGLSDQAGTGIRAIFHNWHALGNRPPHIHNDKGAKSFELILPKQALPILAISQLMQNTGVNLTPWQADILSLCSSQASISLTDIRSLGITTSKQALMLAEELVQLGYLERLSHSRFQASASWQDQVAATALFTVHDAGSTVHDVDSTVHDTESTVHDAESTVHDVESTVHDVDSTVHDVDSTVHDADATLQITRQVWRLLSVMSSEHSRVELQAKLELNQRANFTNKYLIPALDANLIEMTQPSTPRSNKQRYRLSKSGMAFRAKLESIAKVPPSANSLEADKIIQFSNQP